MNSFNEIKLLLWKRYKNNSKKADFYSENLFEKSSNFRKLEIEYPDLAYGFNWLLKIRCDYRFDSIIAKKVNIVNDNCSVTCPCCNSNS